MTVTIEHQQLRVIGETVAHRVEIVCQALVVDAGVNGLSIHQRNALQVLGDFVGAREDAQVVAELFHPQIDFAHGLRADPQQLL